MPDPKPPVDLSMFRAISDRTSSSRFAEGTAATAELSRFVEDPDNPRTEFDTPEFKSLVEDIWLRGILQPVVVVPRSDGKLLIRFGARRFRAAQILGLPVIPYVVVTDERQKDDISQWQENERRSGFTPMERARFVQKLLAKGMAKQDIASALQISPQSVTHLVSLAESPGFILDLYESGKCQQAEYLWQLRKLWEADPKKVARQCAAEDFISPSFIKKLKALVESRSVAPSTAQGSKRTAKTATRRALPAASNETARPSLVYQGRSMRIARGLIVLVGEDGTEYEVGGDALAEWVGSTTASPNSLEMGASEI